MPALLINLRIDQQEKFEFFKVTLADLSGLFQECHIKIRGAYAQECVKYAQARLGNAMHLYQELQERDWVAATLEMLNQVESRSVFLYFEDHKLVASRQRLEQTLAAFDQSNLDYLCYSFFKASQLDVKNLLPLGAVQRELFSEFYLSGANLDLLGKISPNYYTFSLLSVVSVEYFKLLLSTENKRTKIFSKILTGFLVRLMHLQRRRRAVDRLNHQLSRFRAILCLHHPSSPFNLEKLWFESRVDNRKWKYAIPRFELFANYDDDNGVYEESLIKRGLYPFEPNKVDKQAEARLNSIAHQITMNGGEHFDCTYHSHNARISRAPLVRINVIRGSVAVLYQGGTFGLSSGEARSFYANLGPIIQCLEPAELELRIFDEVFE